MYNYSFIFFIFSAFLICILMLVLGRYLGSYTLSKYKHIPFESGVIAYGNTKLRFSIQFYLLAVFFVLFDVEILYIYTWVINIKRIGWIGFIEIFIFIFILLLSIIYLLKNKIFNWIPKKSINYINK